MRHILTADLVGIQSGIYMIVRSRSIKISTVNDARSYCENMFKRLLRYFKNPAVNHTRSHNGIYLQILFQVLIRSRVGFL